MSRSANFALRLPRSIKDAIAKVAEAEGVSMNQFIATAAGEKLAALSTASYLAERRQRGDLDRLDRILSREGGAAPRPGDDFLP